jgi:hypothetical protein
MAESKAAMRLHSVRLGCGALLCSGAAAPASERSGRHRGVALRYLVSTLVALRYLVSFYGAFATMLTVGYGDIQPHSTEDRATAVFVVTACVPTACGTHCLHLLWLVASVGSKH